MNIRFKNVSLIFIHEYKVREYKPLYSSMNISLIFMNIILMFMDIKLLNKILIFMKNPYIHGYKAYIHSFTLMFMNIKFP